MTESTEQLEQAFYDAASEYMQISAQKMLRQHPEIRSIIAIFDYNGALNDAKIPHAVWTGRGPQGQAETPEAILGAGYQVTKLLQSINQRAMDVLRLREQQILAASRRLLELEQKIALKTNETQGTP